MEQRTPSRAPASPGAIACDPSATAELLKIAVGMDVRSPLNDIMGKTYQLRSALEILASAHDSEIDPPDPAHVRSYCHMLMDVVGSIDGIITDMDGLVREAFNAR